MGGAHPQRGRGIIAAARADDGDAFRVFPEIVGKLVIGPNIAIRVGLVSTRASPPLFSARPLADADYGRH
jgi:hypothetical protein